MLALYCSTCGGKNHYAVKKPLFCGKCGKSFSAITTAKTVIKSKPDVFVHREEEDAEGTVSLPNLSKISIEIVPDRKEKIRFGDIAETRLGLEPEQRRSIPKKISEKQILEELRAESVSSRGVSSIEIGR